MSYIFSGLLAAALTVHSYAQDTGIKLVPCPIKTKLEQKVHPLTNKALLAIDPAWKQPFLVAGFTKTDFSNLKPWSVKKCGDSFCVTPIEQTLVHQIFIRPERLRNGAENPRWLPLAQFPCGVTPDKSFATRTCTIEHEKVHVVQRDDALAEACPFFINALENIKEPSAAAAETRAQAALVEVKSAIAKADNENVPYKIEWDCNRKRASEAGITCTDAPNEDSLPYAQELKKSGVVFEAKFLQGSTMLESKGPIKNSTEGCTKKQWYFAGRNLEQENCHHDGGSITKTFYWYGKKQRTIEVDKAGKKTKETLIFDPASQLKLDE